MGLPAPADTLEVTADPQTVCGVVDDFLRRRCADWRYAVGQDQGHLRSPSASLFPRGGVWWAGGPAFEEMRERDLLRLEGQWREKGRREKKQQQEWALWDPSIEPEDLAHVVIWVEWHRRQGDTAEPCDAHGDRVAVVALRFSEPVDASRREVEVYMPPESPPASDLVRRVVARLREVYPQVAQPPAGRDAERAAAAPGTLPVTERDLGSVALPRASTYRIDPALAGVPSPSAHPGVASLLDDEHGGPATPGTQARAPETRPKEQDDLALLHEESRQARAAAESAATSASLILGQFERFQNTLAPAVLAARRGLTGFRDPTFDVSFRQAVSALSQKYRPHQITVKLVADRMTVARTALHGRIRTDHVDFKGYVAELLKDAPEPHRHFQTPSGHT